MSVPYKIYTVLTDNGAQFCIQPRYRNGATARYIRHMFDLRCDRFGIEHRLTQPKHPWTNGQVERMNRTIKEATFKRYHYQSHEQLKAHLQTFYGLQLCLTAEDTQWDNTLRINLQKLDNRT